MGEVLKGDYIGFTFNGIHSSELGIIRTSEGSRFNDNLLPTFKDRTTEIPGGDGSYFFGSNYTQRQFSISIAYDSLTDMQLRRLRQVFGDKGIHDLIFDENPYKVYKVKSTGTPQLKYLAFDADTNNRSYSISNKWELYGQPDPVQRDRIYKGEGTLTFIAYDPYAYSRYRYLDEYNLDNVPEWGSMNTSWAGHMNSNYYEWVETTGMVRSDYQEKIEDTTYTIDTFRVKEANEDSDYDGGALVYNPGDIPTNFQADILIDWDMDYEYLESVWRVYKKARDSGISDEEIWPETSGEEFKTGYLDADDTNFSPTFKKIIELLKKRRDRINNANNENEENILMIYKSIIDFPKLQAYLKNRYLGLRDFREELIDSYVGGKNTFGDIWEWMENNINNNSINKESSLIKASNSSRKEQLNAKISQIVADRNYYIDTNNNGLSNYVQLENNQLYDWQAHDYLKFISYFEVADYNNLLINYYKKQKSKDDNYNALSDPFFKQLVGKRNEKIIKGGAAYRRYSLLSTVQTVKWLESLDNITNDLLELDCGPRNKLIDREPGLLDIFRPMSDEEMYLYLTYLIDEGDGDIMGQIIKEYKENGWTDDEGRYNLNLLKLANLRNMKINEKEGYYRYSYFDFHSIANFRDRLKDDREVLAWIKNGFDLEDFNRWELSRKRNFLKIILLYANLQNIDDIDSLLSITQSSDPNYARYFSIDENGEIVIDKIAWMKYLANISKNSSKYQQVINGATIYQNELRSRYNLKKYYLALRLSNLTEKENWVRKQISKFIDKEEGIEKDLPSKYGITTYKDFEELVKKDSDGTIIRSKIGSEEFEYPELKDSISGDKNKLDSFIKDLLFWTIFNTTEEYCNNFAKKISELEDNNNLKSVLINVSESIPTSIEFGEDIKEIFTLIYQLVRIYLNIKDLNISPSDLSLNLTTFSNIDPFYVNYNVIKNKIKDIYENLEEVFGDADEVCLELLKIIGFKEKEDDDSNTYETIFDSFILFLPCIYSPFVENNIQTKSFSLLRRINDNYDNLTESLYDSDRADFLFKIDKIIRTLDKNKDYEEIKNITDGDSLINFIIGLNGEESEEHTYNGEVTTTEEDIYTIKQIDPENSNHVIIEVSYKEKDDELTLNTFIYNDKEVKTAKIVKDDNNYKITGYLDENAYTIVFTINESIYNLKLTIQNIFFKSTEKELKFFNEQFYDKNIEDIFWNKIVGGSLQRKTRKENDETIDICGEIDFSKMLLFLWREDLFNGSSGEWQGLYSLINATRNNKLSDIGKAHLIKTDQEMIGWLIDSTSIGPHLGRENPDIYSLILYLESIIYSENDYMADLFKKLENITNSDLDTEAKELAFNRNRKIYHNCHSYYSFRTLTDLELKTFLIVYSSVLSNSGEENITEIWYKTRKEYQRLLNNVKEAFTEPEKCLSKVDAVNELNKYMEQVSYSYFNKNNDNNNNNKNSSLPKINGIDIPDGSSYEQVILNLIAELKADKIGVAAATWNGNYGWSGGTIRAIRYEEIFGYDNGIQTIVNQDSTVDTSGDFSYRKMYNKWVIGSDSNHKLFGDYIRKNSISVDTDVMNEKTVTNQVESTLGSFADSLGKNLYSLCLLDKRFHYTIEGFEYYYNGKELLSAKRLVEEQKYIEEQKTIIEKSGENSAESIDFFELLKTLFSKRKKIIERDSSYFPIKIFIDENDYEYQMYAEVLNHAPFTDLLYDYLTTEDSSKKEELKLVWTYGFDYCNLLFKNLAEENEFGYIDLGLWLEKYIAFKGKGSISEIEKEEFMQDLVNCEFAEYKSIQDYFNENLVLDEQFSILNEVRNVKISGNINLFSIYKKVYSENYDKIIPNKEAHDEKLLEILTEYKNNGWTNLAQKLNAERNELIKDNIYYSTLYDEEMHEYVRIYCDDHLGRIRALYENRNFERIDREKEEDRADRELLNVLMQRREKYIQGRSFYCERYILQISEDNDSLEYYAADTSAEDLDAKELSDELNNLNDMFDNYISGRYYNGEQKPIGKLTDLYFNTSKNFSWEDLQNYCLCVKKENEDQFDIYCSLESNMSQEQYRKYAEYMYLRKTNPLNEFINKLQNMNVYFTIDNKNRIYLNFENEDDKTILEELYEDFCIISQLGGARTNLIYVEDEGFNDFVKCVYYQFLINKDYESFVYSLKNMENSVELNELLLEWKSLVMDNSILFVNFVPDNINDNYAQKLLEYYEQRLLNGLPIGGGRWKKSIGGLTLKLSDDYEKDHFIQLGAFGLKEGCDGIRIDVKTNTILGLSNDELEEDAESILMDDFYNKYIIDGDFFTIPILETPKLMKLYLENTYLRDEDGTVNYSYRYI